MATYLGPQDNTNMPQAQWQEMMQALFTSGVLQGALNQFAVTTTSGLGISVASGKGMINGFYARSDAAVPLTAAAADPTNPRIDRAVLHADLTAHSLSVILLTGTPAPSPTPPVLTQTASVWEISLSQVRVNANSLTITSLTDERAFVQPNLQGATIGNASGQIPVSNGTRNVNLNADQLDGLDSTAFVQAIAGSTATPLIGVGDLAHRPAAGTKWRLYVLTPFS